MCPVIAVPHGHTWYIPTWSAKTRPDFIYECTMNVPWKSMDLCQQQVLASPLPVADVLPLRLCPMCHHQSPAEAWCSTAFPVADSFTAPTSPSYESSCYGRYWVLWIMVLEASSVLSFAGPSYFQEHSCWDIYNFVQELVLWTVIPWPIPGIPDWLTHWLTPHSLNHWMNGQMIEWLKEWMKDWLNERMPSAWFYQTLAQNVLRVRTCF